MTLTPDTVRAVAFDKAPLGRRGYHEAQVDAFLDRVEAALSGTDQLTADDVQAVTFDAAPLTRRGYAEDQVDALLDLIAVQLTQPGDAEPSELRIPLPPAPPGVHGYLPDDVACLVRLFAGGRPTAAELFHARPGRMAAKGVGFDPDAVDAVLEAWLRVAR